MSKPSNSNITKLNPKTAKVQVQVNEIKRKAMALSNINSKPQIQSVSIWGSLVAFGASALTIVGQLVTDPSILALIPGHIIPYIGAAGAVVSYIGRVTAKDRIKGVVSSD